MSKKKNRPPTAQNLIDSLLDEKSRPDLSTPETKSKSSLASEDEATASIVIDFQQKVEERSGISRVSKNGHREETREISFGSQPSQADLSLSSPEFAKVQDPVAKAQAQAQTNDLENQRTIVQSANAIDADDRTQAVAHETGTTNQNTTNARTQNPSPILTRTDQEADGLGTIDRMMPTEIKNLGGTNQRESKQKVAAPNYVQAGGAFSSAEAALKQSESLRFAQKRITELEQEVERLRRENENLTTAGETLRRRTDELLSKSEQLEVQSKEAEKIHENEKHIYRGQIHQKDRELMDLRNRLEEMEGRLENNFKKIRVRERELEHRLEIIKMESATLISTKDKMILELKRQIDQLNHENVYSKQKSAELFNQFKGKQETIRRVVRALRIALTILEGDEDASSASKKNDSSG